jgi:hypothetical protein
MTGGSAPQTLVNFINTFSVLLLGRAQRIQRFKKHKAVDHCKDLPTNLAAFRRKWNGVRLRNARL